MEEPLDESAKPSRHARNEIYLHTPESWTEAIDPLAMFGRAAPLEVDLGCGKGRFLTERAREFPEHNFIGVDRQLVRIRKVGSKLRRQEVSNVRLLRIEISYAVQYLFPAASVNTYYLFFPDPWPKKRHHRRRLVQKPFLDQVHRTLAPDGVIHLATDHAHYFEQMVEVFGEDPRFEPRPAFAPDEEEQTEFEEIFLAQGLKIGRCSFAKLPED